MVLTTHDVRTENFVIPQRIRRLISVLYGLLWMMAL